MRYSETCPICGTSLNREYLRVLRPNINQTVGARQGVRELTDFYDREERIPNHQYIGAITPYKNSPSAIATKIKNFQFRRPIQELSSSGAISMRTLPDVHPQNHKAHDQSVLIKEFMCPNIEKLSAKYPVFSDDKLAIKPQIKLKANSIAGISSDKAPTLDDQETTKRPFNDNRPPFAYNELELKACQSADKNSESSLEIKHSFFPSRMQIGKLFLRRGEDPRVPNKFHKRNASELGSTIPNTTKQ